MAMKLEQRNDGWTVQKMIYKYIQKGQRRSADTTAIPIVG